MTANVTNAGPIQQSTYVLYENRSNRQVTVHKNPCRFVGQHGFVSQTFPPTGWYTGPFKNRRSAEWKANLTGFQKFICSECNRPDSP